MASTAKKKMAARNPETMENYLINLAMKLAEKKLLEGTASSQVITTLLNLGTTKAQLENERLRSDLRVAEAKIEQLNRQTSSSGKYEEALKAFKSYQGVGYEEEDYDEEY